MSAFQSSLVTRILAPNELQDGTQLYALASDFVYQSDLLGEIVVPDRYITDFASIPRIAWRYISPEDPCILFASLVHDWLYTRMGTLPNGCVYARSDADRVLREAMALCGARGDQMAIVFNAVRLFGGSHWKSP